MLAGCGASAVEKPPGPPPARPGPAEFEVRLVPDWSSTYIEGAVTTIEVDGLRGAAAFQPVIRHRGSLAETTVRRRLPSGIYRLRVWQRVCGGTCESLSEPADRCETRFAMPDRVAKRLTVDVLPGRPCRISER